MDAGGAGQAAVAVLGRRSPGLDRFDSYGGARVLVTGGTGSIGSQIVEQLLGAGAGVVRVLSRDETKQLELQERLARRWDLARARFLIGDVRDPVRLRRAMEGVDVVFHAAAMKHVPACEYNPFEAVQTNVLGTQNVITSSRDAGVGRVVVVSTDKATSPENTMGATKLLAERLVSSAHLFSPGQVFCAVRFGNVLGSRGSIVPRVLRQLEEEGRASLTHDDMTRFMMTIEDAVSLLLEAGRRARGGEIFILAMPALRVRDLVEVLVAEYARASGRAAEELPIHRVGIRPGEKLHETLVTAEEGARLRPLGDRLHVVEPPQRGPAPREYRETALGLDSSRGPFLSRQEIGELLERGGVLGSLRRRRGDRREEAATAVERELEAVAIGAEG
jgi:FlaA1/EpsC-like NDP-sugar epimerase